MWVDLSNSEPKGLRSFRNGTYFFITSIVVVLLLNRRRSLWPFCFRRGEEAPLSVMFAVDTIDDWFFGSIAGGDVGEVNRSWLGIIADAVVQSAVYYV